MAGIYISGMEMPVGHNEATFGIDADGHPLLMVYTEKDTEPEIYDLTLIPGNVKLIDVDSHIKYLESFREKYHGKEFLWEIMLDAFIYELQQAPTVIPEDIEQTRRCNDGIDRKEFP